MAYKILIVEDTLAIREEICDILEMEGYQVIQATNGKTGYEMTLKESPDLIISDILMPSVDGFEMFKNLQERKGTSAIPLIFLSAKSKKKDIRIGMNLGADDYLTKPINIKDLISAVDNKIKKKIIIDQIIIEKTAAIKHILKNQKNQIEKLENQISEMTDLLTNKG
jgi:DNA-binding response OmpR family regulator